VTRRPKGVGPYKLTLRRCGGASPQVGEFQRQSAPESNEGGQKKSESRRKIRIEDWRGQRSSHIGKTGSEWRLGSHPQTATPPSLVWLRSKVSRPIDHRGSEQSSGQNRDTASSGSQQRHRRSSSIKGKNSNNKLKGRDGKAIPLYLKSKISKGCERKRAVEQRGSQNKQAVDSSNRLLA